MDTSVDQPAQKRRRDGEDDKISEKENAASKGAVLVWVSTWAINSSTSQFIEPPSPNVEHLTMRYFFCSVPHVKRSDQVFGLSWSTDCETSGHEHHTKQAPAATHYIL